MLVHLLVIVLLIDLLALPQEPPPSALGEQFIFHEISVDRRLGGNIN
jgi:hypothetical protein